MNMYYRLIVLVLALIGLFLFHISAFAEVVVCNTMVGNNSTDNSEALNACMIKAASQPEKTVNIPAAAGAYKVSSKLTVPEGLSIIGGKGAALNATFRLSNYSKLINIDFSDKSRAVIIGERGPFITGAQIRDCTFGNSDWASIMIYKGNETIIDNNTFTNGGKGSNIQFLGGKRNIITNNTITGGKTGIILKYYRKGNGGGFDSMFMDNIIKGNVISGHREEGISIDSNPSNSNSTPQLEYDMVSAVNGTVITLTHAGWGGGNDPDYTGYYIIPVTGSAIGQYRKITRQSNASFTLESAFTGLSTGDGVSIGAVFTGNVIAYNSVTGGFRDSRILLYGSCFNNRVEYNDVGRDGGITVKSLDRGVVSSISVTGAAGRGPCGHNLIRGNKTANIWIRYRCHNIAGSYGPYMSYGNAVVDNTITGKLTVNYQYYWSKGNAGGFSLNRTSGNDCSGKLQRYAVDLKSISDKKINPPPNLRINTN